MWHAVFGIYGIFAAVIAYFRRSFIRMRYAPTQVWHSQTSSVHTLKVAGFTQSDWHCAASLAAGGRVYWRS